MGDIKDVIPLICEMSEDRRIPRNIRAMIKDAADALQKEDESDVVKLSTAINLLEESSNDPNIAAFSRTEIWNAVSMLESLQSDLEWIFNLNSWGIMYTPEVLRTKTLI